ncbi:MAG: hypothetical protein AABY22_34770, partial [Nanoarchaeota archaeon]
MVTYKGLRDSIQNLEKIEECVKIERPPVINEGYPGQFNVSFTEYPWLIEHGKYMDFDHAYVFSTVPSCIRWNDIYDEKTKSSRLESEDSWKYLGVFEMADLAGMASLTKRPVDFRVLRELQKRTGLDRDSLQRYEEITKKNVELQTLQTINLVDLLNSLGIAKNRIYPSYQAGGNVRQITNGRFTFDFEVPEDSLGKNLFLEQGIPLENLIPDRSRDTLLSLRLERELSTGHKGAIPSPWGYRNEINVNIGTKENPKYVDVGTLERFAWKPICEGDKIIGLTDIEDIVSIGAVGLERLCMVVNGLEKVQDIDCIKPFYDALPLKEKRELVGESLRTLHRIYADAK